MRGFDCHYYHMKDDNTLYKNTNNACWAGLNRDRPLEINIYDPEKGYTKLVLKKEEKNSIYIDKYIDNEVSNEVRKRIVYLINKITPCSFEKIGNITYIKYTMLPKFYSDLLLLNLIRTLWYRHSPVFNLKQFHIDLLKRKPQGKDYLEFIMETISKNVITENAKYSYGDHSFVYPNIVPKTKDKLISYKGNSMQGFLQQTK